MALGSAFYVVLSAYLILFYAHFLTIGKWLFGEGRIVYAICFNLLLILALAYLDRKKNRGIIFLSFWGFCYGFVISVFAGLLSNYIVLEGFWGRVLSFVGQGFHRISDLLVIFVLYGGWGFGVLMGILVFSRKRMGPAVQAEYGEER